MPSSNTSSQNENTGRWTAEEHRLFLQGLQQHGKAWKKIASLIKSRTVVQIRTHAQKYFQKIAKARQNGEEGEVHMEERGGFVSSLLPVPSVSQSKRRRQTTGTKRKAIQSIVASAEREGKRLMIAEGLEKPPLPAIAPTLAHFLVGGRHSVGPVHMEQGTMSGAALEESIFRFLTPVPVASNEPQVNAVARQAGANPICAPTGNPSAAPCFSGEVSPTGVSELSLYPSWADAKDTPSWYAKGADVDALLDVADSLDWLADAGDLHDTGRLKQHVKKNSTSSLPRIDSNAVAMPSIFESAPDSDEHLQTKKNSSVANLHEASSLHDELQVFDTPMDEHDFVSSMLDEH